MKVVCRIDNVAFSSVEKDSFGGLDQPAKRVVKLWHASAAQSRQPTLTQLVFMRRTLLLIPHELFGLPLFGLGWALILIALAFGIRLYFARKNKEELSSVLAGEGMMWGAIAAAVVFVVPRIELQNIDGDPVGLAVRGYGVMLLLAVGCAVMVAAKRAKNRGINPDAIFSLAPWALVGGIAGARIFYLIQYRADYDWSTLQSALGNLFSFTQGGLVVYGSFIGGVLAGLIFIHRNRLPTLRLGDAIVPCMFLGVCIGRIGCLMNGCCYGGRCEEGWSALHFPQGSSVFAEQVLSGELLGMIVNQDTKRIEEITEGSLAEKEGIQSGKQLGDIRFVAGDPSLASRSIPVEDVLPDVVADVGGRVYSWPSSQLPERALPVQGAQLISSASAFLLFAILCGLSLVLRRDGATMFVGFACYAVVRFILELVRVDEKGQFGTNLSISQWVSVLVLVASIAALGWLYSRPPAKEATLESVA